MQFLKDYAIHFDEMESRFRTTILQLSETTFLHLLPLTPENHILYTSHLFSFNLSNYYSDNNAQIIHLWEDQWIHSNQVIKSRLRSLIGRSNRIYARETTVHKIDQSSASNFLNEHHLNGSTKSKYKYGLRYKGDLVAVLTLGAKVRFNNRKFSYEIIRYCSASNTTVVGGLSKLLHAFKKDHDPGHLMTYIDRDWSNGDGFRTQGFSSENVTGPVMYWLSLEEKKRYFPNRMNEDIMLNNPTDWIKIYNSGNFKYTWEK